MADFGRDLSAAQEPGNIAALFPTPQAVSGTGWYYRYTPTQPNDNQVTTAYQFVPMFYNGADVTSPNLTAAAAYPWVLGFNEPDLASQANMTVAQALTLWPQLEAMGNKLVSPAASGSENVAGSWLDLFITGNGGGYIPRVDAIALHHYTSNFSDTAAGSLIAYVDAVWARYKKPIWITEFGMINFGAGGLATQTYPTVAQAQAFLASAIAAFRYRISIGQVLRFAWYPDVVSQAALNDWGSTGIGRIALANPDGTLTALGTTYSLL